MLARAGPERGHGWTHGGTQRFLGTTGSGCSLLPHLDGAGCRFKFPEHQYTVQQQSQEQPPFPSTLPPATVLQSNKKKAGTATSFQPGCFCWCLWPFPACRMCPTGFLPATAVGCILTWALTSAHGLLNLTCAWAKAGWRSLVIC